MVAISSSVSAANIRPGGESGQRSNRLEKSLTDYLQSQGVSAEDQAKILSELKDSLQSLRTSGSRPDPTAFKDAIKSVLSAHGVDGESFVQQIPTRGAGQHGPGGASGPGGPRGGGHPHGDGDGDESGTTSTNATSSISATSGAHSQLDAIKELLTTLSQSKSSSTPNSQIANLLRQLSSGQQLDVKA